MQFGLNQFIFALSDTLDLVGVDETYHGKRVGYMAWYIANILGYPKERAYHLFQLGLLHDYGVSSSKIHKKLTSEFDWIDSHIHCDTGAERLSSIKWLRHFAPAIKYHHTPWKELQNIALDTNTRLASNLIFLTDRIDTLTISCTDQRWPLIKKAMNTKINELKDNYFEADLVDGFLEASDREAFWFTLEPTHLQNFLNQRKIEKDDIFLESEDLLSMAELFAQVVDAKSPYTAEHSVGVARLSKYIAKQLGMEDVTCNKIEIAGLLHDLGKLQVPDSILEKTTDLDSDDLSYMRHHSYVSYAILSKINGMEDIARWAANHHEALDGSGYPFHRTAKELCTESRIIIAADIFQALAQNRPYRKALPVEDIVAHLKTKSSDGKLDKEIVSLIDSTQDACYREATNQNSLQTDTHD